MIRDIIFLDIDGVLNTPRYIEKQYIDSDGLTKDMDSNFDPLCVSRLKDILVTTNSDIVISASRRLTTKEWNMHHTNKISDKSLGRSATSWNSILDMLDSIYAKHKLIGVTPISWDADNKRGDDIRRWLNNTAYRIRNFVILDDDVDMCEYTDTNLAKCDPYYGITSECRDKAIQILTKRGV